MSLDKRPRVLPIQKTSMPDLPMKPASATAKMVKRASPAKKTTVKRAQTSTVAKRPVKHLPTKQPRDPLGRFARKTGQVLWAGVKATGRAVVGTAKGIKKVHKAVKRARAGYRQRANLELRERKIALIERERKAGLKRKTVRRKRRK